MPPDTIEVTSPTPQTKPGDANGSRPGNLTLDQASFQLLASAQKQATPKPATPVAEEIASESTGTVVLDPPEVSATEAQNAPESAPAEETIAPETTEVATTPEAEPDSVPSQISFTPEQQDLLNRRIGKEIAKSTALRQQSEAKIKELEAKLAQQRPAEVEPTQTQPPPVVVLGNQPLSNVVDFAQLSQARQTAKEAIRYVETILDEPEQWKQITIPDPTGQGNEKVVKVHEIGGKFYTETDMKRSMREAKVTLEDHIPAREQFLQQRQKTQQMAHAEFPWMADKTSPLYQQAQAAKRDPANAAIMASPNADWIIGVQVEGWNAIQARKTAATNGAVAAKPKVAAPKPPADQTTIAAAPAATRQPPGSMDKQNLAAERARLSRKNGITSEDAVAHLKRIEQLRSKPR